MRKAIIAAALIFPSICGAQEVGSVAASRIVMSGEVISSARVSPDDVPDLDTFYGGQAIHEMYIREDGKLYLCYVYAQTDKKFGPLSACFGS